MSCVSAHHRVPVIDWANSRSVHISVDVYGENRFNKTFDPCEFGIDSLCPLNASVPIQAIKLFDISPTDVAGIPAIALGVPDLEGRARLQIFANSTRASIGCFQAVMSNGNSFSQPQIVGSVPQKTSIESPS